MSQPDDPGAEPRPPSPAAPLAPGRNQTLSPAERRIVEAGEAGPHAPGHPDPRPDPGPETGGYDDHSPSRAPDNAKGGYGAG
ncbi:hypothetical protein GCM10007886_24770 [Methylobacterium gregans]|uniref:Uncharacterized protein n=1 Tax=Methylobacterium gregans TaxID=374424 RepID=A0AA37MBJ0_9HYPH|nr:hypothetical protein [Methylobacterium gregans]MDQ0521129.1 hypothetical protein [Methylobacterium gregans]GJD79143.1 hypothetical protein NBEOAGPD_2364 [Methylobacterium gregans]GLS54294.1 hypothetical protein GCM10007886_24770 [Methylobacterium gregans]